MEVETSHISFLNVVSDYLASEEVNETKSKQCVEEIMRRYSTYPTSGDRTRLGDVIIEIIESNKTNPYVDTPQFIKWLVLLVDMSLDNIQFADASELCLVVFEHVDLLIKRLRNKSWITMIQYKKLFYMPKDRTEKRRRTTTTQHIFGAKPIAYFMYKIIRQVFISNLPSSSSVIKAAKIELQVLMGCDDNSHGLELVGYACGISVYLIGIEQNVSRKGVYIGNVFYLLDKHMGAKSEVTYAILAKFVQQCIVWKVVDIGQLYLFVDILVDRFDNSRNKDIIKLALTSIDAYCQQLDVYQINKIRDSRIEQAQLLYEEREKARVEEANKRAQRLGGVEGGAVVPIAFTERDIDEIINETHKRRRLLVVLTDRALIRIVFGKGTETAVIMAMRLNIGINICKVVTAARSLCASKLAAMIENIDNDLRTASDVARYAMYFASQASAMTDEEKYRAFNKTVYIMSQGSRVLEDITILEGFKDMMVFLDALRYDVFLYADRNSWGSTSRLLEYRPDIQLEYSGVVFDMVCLFLKCFRDSEIDNEFTLKIREDLTYTLYCIDAMLNSNHSYVRDKAHEAFSLIHNVNISGMRGVMVYGGIKQKSFERISMLAKAWIRPAEFADSKKIILGGSSESPVEFYIHTIAIDMYLDGLDTMIEKLKDLEADKDSWRLFLMYNIARCVVDMGDYMPEYSLQEHGLDVMQMFGDCDMMTARGYIDTIHPDRGKRVGDLYNSTYTDLFPRVNTSQLKHGGVVVFSRISNINLYTLGDMYDTIHTEANGMTKLYVVRAMLDANEFNLDGYPELSGHKSRAIDEDPAFFFVMYYFMVMGLDESFATFMQMTEFDFCIQLARTCQRCNMNTLYTHIYSVLASKKTFHPVSTLQISDMLCPLVAYSMVYYYTNNPNEIKRMAREFNGQHHLLYLFEKVPPGEYVGYVYKAAVIKQAARARYDALMKGTLQIGGQRTLNSGMRIKPQSTESIYRPQYMDEEMRRENDKLYNEEIEPIVAPILEYVPPMPTIRFTDNGNNASELEATEYKNIIERNALKKTEYERKRASTKARVEWVDVNLIEGKFGTVPTVPMPHVLPDAQITDYDDQADTYALVTKKVPRPVMVLEQKNDKFERSNKWLRELTNKMLLGVVHPNTELPDDGTGVIHAVNAQNATSVVQGKINFYVKNPEKFIEDTRNGEISDILSNLVYTELARISNARFAAARKKNKMLSSLVDNAEDVSKPPDHAEEQPKKPQTRGRARKAWIADVLRQVSNEESSSESSSEMDEEEEEYEDEEESEEEEESGDEEESEDEPDE